MTTDQLWTFYETPFLTKHFVIPGVMKVSSCIDICSSQANNYFFTFWGEVGGDKSRLLSKVPNEASLNWFN